MPPIDFLLQIAAWLICMPLTLSLGIFVTEVAAGLFPTRAMVTDPVRPSAVVITPAHNEASTLGASLAALKSVLPSDVRMLVVADNCTDATADIARLSGAEVIERSDPVRRGKGFALAFARQHLSTAPPACVIVLDADCVPAAGTIDALREAAAHWQVPVQSTNLLRPDLAAAPMVQISNFGFVVKNLIRQRGAGRVGGVAVLGGTGMALPWDLFADAPLASSDLVEDLSLGIFAVRVGRAPRFVEHAHVESAAAEGSSALTQRTRWEHGFIGTATKRAVPLIVDGVRLKRLAYIWMGFHLCVPPLAMLCGLAGIGLVALTGIGAISGVFTPAIVLALFLTATLALVMIVWLQEGRAFLAAGVLVRLPLYVLWKVPIYLKLFGRRESEWKRTKRTGE